MLICQEIELDPTGAQRELFISHAHAARVARNDLIAQWREEGKRLPGFRLKLAELRPWMNRDKFQRHPWYKGLSQNAVKGGYIDAEDAIVRYYKGQNRRPRFLGKSARLRFRADNGIGSVKVSETDRMELPVIGTVRMKEPLRWDSVIRECRIKEMAGRWYASVRMRIDDDEYPHRCGEGVIGIDLGLKDFAVIAYPGDTEEDVTKVEAPEPFKRSRRALRRAQRRVSRRKKGSKNHKKAKLNVARKHRRMANIRKDFLHKLSHRLTTGAQVIKVETLSIKGWQKMWGRKTSDLAPGEFLRQLEYKAAWCGGNFVKAQWNFPSTQICHDCGAKTGPVGKSGLKVRRWTCSACGKKHDRDANASLNVRDYESYSSGECQSASPVTVDAVVRPAGPAVAETPHFAGRSSNTPVETGFQ